MKIISHLFPLLVKYKSQFPLIFPFELYIRGTLSHLPNAHGQRIATEIRLSENFELTTNNLVCRMIEKGSLPNFNRF